MNGLKTMSFVAVLVCSGFRIVFADELPVCNNKTIYEVTQRVGCTLGDPKCWLKKGGFCTDYVQKKVFPDLSSQKFKWVRVQPGDVRKGDVAVFNSRSHYAYVESVVKNAQGKPVAVDVSEYNYGNCWVDQQILVTEKYNKVNTRSGIPLNAVDGGFIRSSR